MNGRPVAWNGKELQLKWVREELPRSRCRWPVGRRRSAVAGRVGDGSSSSWPTPTSSTWIMETARSRQAEEAGRDPDALDASVRAEPDRGPTLADARSRVRWFPAMVVEPVVDSSSATARTSEIPSGLTDFAEGAQVLDCNRRRRVGAIRPASWSPARSATVLRSWSTARQAAAKLHELEWIGVDRFNAI